MSKIEKLLTVEDLLRFCETQNFSHFSSAEAGYKLAVQIPSTFTFSEEEQNDEFMFYAKIKLLHSGLNRNGSCVTEEAIENAKGRIKYKPVLANFCEIDGVVDFTSHDIEKKEDGTYIYIEKQVGCFTVDEPYMEYDEENDKNYLWAKVAISKDYTPTYDVIQRKGGTKVSAELYINSMSYDAKTKELQFDDIEVMGVTLLGVNPKTGKPVEEGMKGSKIELEDFSVKNNSITIEKNSKELFNTKEILEEGGNVVLENEDVKLEAVETEETVTEEVEVTEELDADETTDETEEVIEEESVDTEGTDAVEVTENESVEAEGKEEFEETKITVNGKTFELSLDDISRAMYELVNDMYSEADNEWYGVSVYESHVVMHGYCYGKHFKQAYVKSDDKFSLSGDRVEVFSNWLTKEEEASLNEMRSNYAVIEEKLQKYEVAEMKADKMTVFDDASFAQFLETDEFKELMSDESLMKFTKDELCDKANIAFSKLVKEMGSFSMKEEKKIEKKPSMFMFAKKSESSFLDEVLNKK